eukprot:scaffold396770_cov22-Prasinocladus_malaysianus.AAC.1
MVRTIPHGPKQITVQIIGSPPQRITASSAEGGIDGIDTMTGHLQTLCWQGPATWQNTRGLPHAE